VCVPLIVALYSGESGGTNTNATLIDLMESVSHVIIKGEGKAVPLQAWSGPEGSRKLGSQIS
jgi:hypothetical protein